MRIKKRKTIALKNCILIASTIVALSAMGGSYAHYTNNLQINTSITTGNLDVSFDNESNGTLRALNVSNDDGSKGTLDDLDVSFDDASKVMNFTKKIIKENKTDSENNIPDCKKVNNKEDSTNSADTYKYAIINKSSIPIKTTVISSDDLVSAIYENKMVELDLSKLIPKLLASPAGTYQFNVEISFDQLNKQIN